MHSATWPGLLRAEAIADLQELAKLLDREAGVANNTAHRVFVDRIVARHRDDSSAVSHHNVFALGGNGETGLLKSSNRSKMIDAG